MYFVNAAIKAEFYSCYATKMESKYEKNSLLRIAGLP
jgi:hypothetical protein